MLAFNIITMLLKCVVVKETRNAVEQWHLMNFKRNNKNKILVYIFEYFAIIICNMNNME